MYKVEPARPVSPARAESLRGDNESLRIEPAVAADAPIVEPAPKVEPASDQLLSPPTTKKGTHDSKNNLIAGADFYCKCSLGRGAPRKDILKILLPYFFDERDFVSYGECERFIVFRDTTCFVYLDETDSSPLYTIEMEPTFKAMIEDRTKPDKYSVTVNPSGKDNHTSPFYETILLKNKKKKLIFQFTLSVKEDKESARKLLAAIQNAIHFRDNPKKTNINCVVNAQVVGQKSENKF